MIHSMLLLNFLLVIWIAQTQSTVQPSLSPSVAPSHARSAYAIIVAYAGTGSSTSSGSGGPATSAGFGTPRYVYQDTVGNTYISEHTGFCVRQISTSGTISNYAGICNSQGSTGDNGKATSALMTTPIGCFVSSTSVLFVGDYGLYKVRSVSTSGIISLYAGNGVSDTYGNGGAATSAAVHPHGLWGDSTGVLYIAAYTHSQIRAVSNSGIISLFAGTGTGSFSGDGGAATSASLNGPGTIYGDTAGVVYITEYYNNRVRKVTNGIISTFAGNGNSGYSESVAPTSASFTSPVSVAVDRDNGDVYISCRNNGRISVVTASTQLVTTYAGGNTAVDSTYGDGGAATACAFNQPDGIYLDTSGVLYSIDVGNFRTRKVINLMPSVAPTIVPTTVPTVVPTTISPSVSPSVAPSVSPSVVPSVTPSVSPSVVPSVTPSVSPTVIPSTLPTTINPSVMPSMAPTATPTSVPTTVAPSVVPSVTPSLAPSVIPSNSPTTIHPTLKPSVAPTKPTIVPTRNPTVSPTLTDLPIASSPNFKVTNAFAFAGLTSDGGVVTWGSSTTGGDSTSVSSSLTSGVVSVVSSKNAFAAVKSDGSVVAWGRSAEIAGWVAYATSSAGVVSMVATEQAFAGVTSSGGVVAFGAGCCGGSVNQYGTSSYLTSDVKSISASAGAFCALKTDGSVYCWGSAFAGGGVSSVSRSDIAGVVLLAASRSSFAGLTSDGSVVVWGQKVTGGSLPSAVSASLNTVTEYVLSSESGFVGYTTSSSLVSWGWTEATSTVTDVSLVAHTSKAFAVLKSDGSVTVWGDSKVGGDASSVSSQLTSSVSSVVGSLGAFAAVTSSGGVVAWGHAGRGGQLFANVSSGMGVISSVVATKRAFAALSSSGGVTVWGASNFGGEVSDDISSKLTSDVKLVCANDAAFTAITTAGSGYVWGFVNGDSESYKLSGDYSTVVSC